MSDKFGSYVSSDERHTLSNNPLLADKNYGHHWVNHSENFVDPATGAHTQTLVGVWEVCVKRFLKTMRGIRKNAHLGTSQPISPLNRHDKTTHSAVQHYQAEVRASSTLRRTLHQLSQVCAERCASKYSLDLTDQVTKLVATSNAKRAVLGGQGTKCIIPFQRDLPMFMEDVRRDEHILTSMYTINFMKTHYNDWLLQYQANKPNHTRPCCVCAKRFAHRHRFYQHVACHFMLPTSDIVQIRDNFASKIGSKYDGHNLRDIINVTRRSFTTTCPRGRFGPN
ncbi:hypothetical protein H257_17700 [Aphanomyces astaci]|uniref:C2H2-type domain-containing protein n=1 Tax=Aphanomyces astaci TaxID=112090 RepID=W4FDT9_APHAT|nr:hypothetical protein H257_17700 [Aphanomyces astaci]ETV65652.1 hypothetical protein H257_17700 [Aphanomyces astaci]|eukprot:XP_009844891.1 hypothetical protein H257_17700 [Aphanomyces astaci]